MSEKRYNVYKVEEQEEDPNYYPNYKICNYFNRRRLWKHYKKWSPIWAFQVQQNTPVHTLEGKEVAYKGDFVCKGVCGEKWPQKQKRLEQRYFKTDEMKGKWQKWKPKQQLNGVFAVRVHKDFKIETKWGTMKGSKGDYLVKDYSDKDTKYPDNLWIIRKDIFIKSYRHIPNKHEMSNILQFMQIVSNGNASPVGSTNFTLDFNDMKLVEGTEKENKSQPNTSSSKSPQQSSNQNEFQQTDKQQSKKQTLQTDEQQSEQQQQSNDNRKAIAKKEEDRLMRNILKRSSKTKKNTIFGSKNNAN